MSENTEKTKVKRASNVNIEQRKRINVSGVEEVVNISETFLTLITSSGALNVTGTGMRINKYNAEEGFLVVDGDIEGLRYAEAVTKGGLFKKIFK